MAVDCGKVLGVIDGIVKEPEFVRQTKELVDKHCDTFTEDTENKLEYTVIHNEYVSFVENFIEKNLTEKMGPDFDMGVFMDALPDYIEKGGDGTSGKEAASDTIDFLLGFGELESFKDMMLVAKKDKNTNADAIKGTGKVEFSSDHKKVIEEAKHVCHELVGAVEGTAKWKVVSDKPWMKLERKEDGSYDFIRTTMQINLSVAGAEEMLLCFNKERENWDTMMKDFQDDTEIKFTLVMPMAAPQQMHSRLIITRDAPSPGAITYMYLDVDPKTKKLSSAKESLGAGCIFPVEGQPDKCNYRGVDQIKKGWVPRFIMNWVITTWFPKQMTSQIIKYKKLKGIKS
eukprot:CAMPEP_0117696578 /NCGR_PEP_ID=MMETSP0804-20121206/28749_1 /TAXON_ID=1074897 /ORGANISM="Tetraselmis astigmatica, Strain CCMP880" /LENGTH=342 /DNA_ID=CAMNT_0005510729 /DNA_START=95 /DNA_END=1125 /DNA_ORIENTATION=+